MFDTEHFQLYTHPQRQEEKKEQPKYGFDTRNLPAFPATSNGLLNIQFTLCNGWWVPTGFTCSQCGGHHPYIG
jgi:hypothetical protein